MKIYLMLAFACLLSSCANRQVRTKYGPMGNAGGYDEVKIDEKRRVARFVGNAYLRGEWAQLFVKVRALEICKEDGFKFARFSAISDLTESKTVRQSQGFSSSGPVNFSGSASSNGSFGGAISGQNTISKMASWDETFRYPSYKAFFFCTNKSLQAKIAVNAIKPDDMKPYVKDLLGAAQIQEIPTDSPNFEKLQIGDFIVKVENTRIRDNEHFVFLVSNSEKTKLKANVIRDGKPIVVDVNLIESTDLLKKENDDIVAEACEFPEIRGRDICQNRNVIDVSKK